jgi:hypothetical protein
MKKFIVMFFVPAIVLFFASSFIKDGSLNNTRSKIMEKKPIPVEVMKVLEKSCTDCHSDPGSTMAQMHVNLSLWDKYTPNKQIAKAKAMCDIVSKGKMPPKNFRKNHPDKIPAENEIKILCDWAKSLQVIVK